MKGQGHSYMMSTQVLGQKRKPKTNQKDIYRIPNNKYKKLPQTFPCCDSNSSNLVMQLKIKIGAYSNSKKEKEKRNTLNI